jgi:hypothetical protein
MSGTHGLDRLEAIDEQILQIIETAGDVADLLSRTDPSSQGEIMAKAERYMRTLQLVQDGMREYIDEMPPNRLRQTDSYLARAKLEVAAHKADLAGPALRKIIELGAANGVVILPMVESVEGGTELGASNARIRGDGDSDAESEVDGQIDESDDDDGDDVDLDAMADELYREVAQ